jgi:hypothetical protein
MVSPWEYPLFNIKILARQFNLKYNYITQQDRLISYTHISRAYITNPSSTADAVPLPLKGKAYLYFISLPHHYKPAEKNSKTAPQVQYNYPKDNITVPQAQYNCE